MSCGSLRSQFSSILMYIVWKLSLGLIGRLDEWLDVCFLGVGVGLAPRL